MSPECICLRFLLSFAGISPGSLPLSVVIRDFIIIGLNGLTCLLYQKVTYIQYILIFQCHNCTSKKSRHGFLHALILVIFQNPDWSACNRLCRWCRYDPDNTHSGDVAVQDSCFFHLIFPLVVRLATSVTGKTNSPPVIPSSSLFTINSTAFSAISFTGWRILNNA